MKTKDIALLCALMLLLALCACGVGTAETPQTAAPPPAEALSPAAEESPESAAPPRSEDMAICFATTLYGGGDADESLLADAKLTMLNFFEPWCPPCIAELPELQQLSDNYAGEGFQLLGVFSTEQGVDAVLENAGVSYRVLRYVSAFDRFQTGYVPTTVFLDSAGNQVGETVIGARSYEDWEEIVKELLEK